MNKILNSFFAICFFTVFFRPNISAEKLSVYSLTNEEVSTILKRCGARAPSVIGDIFERSGIRKLNLDKNHVNKLLGIWNNSLNGMLSFAIFTVGRGIKWDNVNLFSLSKSPMMKGILDGYFEQFAIWGGEAVENLKKRSPFEVYLYLKQLADVDSIHPGEIASVVREYLKSIGLLFLPIQDMKQ